MGNKKRSPGNQNHDPNLPVAEFSVRLPSLGHEAAQEYLRKLREQAKRENQEKNRRWKEFLARRAREQGRKKPSRPGERQQERAAGREAEFQEQEGAQFISARQTVEEKGQEKKGEQEDEENEEEEEFFQQSRGMSNDKDAILEAMKRELEAPKLESEVQQERIQAAIVGAAVGTTAILTAMGIQAALTNTFESLMPAKAYKWVYLYLLAFLYLVLMIFFVTFFVN